MYFPERLKQLRAEHHITQVQLAQIVGSVDRTFRRYEAGTMQPTLPVLMAISQHFNISIDWLCGISNDPIIHSPASSTSEEAAALEREAI